MQPTASSGREFVAPEYKTRQLTRFIAVILAATALGVGLAGLLSLSPEVWGIGLIAFGCLLGILSLLAQAAEHFARSSGASKQGK
jgi:hypothetical protein